MPVLQKEFSESINAACVLEIPVVMSIWDDGYGISVPKKYQTTKESISKALAGFEIEENTNVLKYLGVKAGVIKNCIRPTKKLQNLQD